MYLLPEYALTRTNCVHHADALSLLRALPDASVNCIVTSPPYFGLRDYGVAGQIGLEDTPQAFIAALVDVFHEARRVLRTDGTCWVNLGDSYANDDKWGGSTGGKHASGLHGDSGIGRTRQHTGFKPKDLMLIPHRTAIALKEDGWWLRSDIVWAKCLSGGAAVYAKTQKGEMPMMVKDMVRLDPSTVQLWDGQKWNQVVWWEETAPDPERKKKSAKSRSAKYRGKNAEIAGDIEIELRTGERIGCTRNHRWPTQRGIIEAHCLQVGDVINIARLPEPAEVRQPELLQNHLIAWFIGMYLAEGSLSQGTIQIASHITETQRFDRLKVLAEAFDGYCRWFQTSENGMTININSPVLLGLIKTYIAGQGAKQKHLHPRCWARSNEFLSDLLRGYLEGDGSKQDAGFWKLGLTNNDQLVSDLRTIAARLGYSLRLRRDKAKLNGKAYPCWRGDLRFDPATRRTQDGQIVAIRQSRARKFWNISLADEPHTFCLASGVCTKNSNPMPESVTDRPTKAHEYIFLLTKSERYWYDADAIRETAIYGENRATYIGGTERLRRANVISGGLISSDIGLERPLTTHRNKRSVWTVATQPYADAHFATFPPKLIEPCILAGCPKQVCSVCGAPWVRVVERTPMVIRKTDRSAMGEYGRTQSSGTMLEPARSVTTGWQPSCACHADTQPGLVLDMFMGAGTTALVAMQHGRSYIGSELNAEYVQLARRRLMTDIERLNEDAATATYDDLPLFAAVGE